APHVEDVFAGEVAFPNERVDGQLPRLVGGAKLVVALRDPPEVRARGADGHSATSSSGSVIASMACCAASRDDSGTRIFWGASSVARGWCSTAVSSVVSMPAERRIVWIS